jgi:hypothetical protein
MIINKKFLHLSTFLIVSMGLGVESWANGALAPTTRFIGESSGIFTNNDEGVVTGIGTNFFTWGTPVTSVSSLSFTGLPFDVGVRTGYVYGPRARLDSEVFPLGDLAYHNGTINSGTQANVVDLAVTPTITDPVNFLPATFSATLGLINSPNTSDPIESADYVLLPSAISPVPFLTPGGAPLTLEIPGFGAVTGSGFTTVDQFFVLEEQNASAQLLGRFVPACEPIINGSVDVFANGPTISAQFTPRFGLSLDQAAGLCGYDHFNWHQVVTTDPYPPAGLVAPYTDPPNGGGVSFGGAADNLPFYWDEFPDNIGSGYNLEDNISDSTLFYSDTPAEPNLQLGEFLGFTTSLAGILADNTWDVLYVFSWKSNFNGTVGGISRPRNIDQPDPGGTGGVYDVLTDLNPEQVSEPVVALMTSQGAKNANLTSVPGPLPIFGVWSAFRFSRKLRERTKSPNAA